MSNYVVSDTSLTAVANAIRAKTGGVSQLTFPTDFVSEIGNISGGIDLDDFLSGEEPSGVIDSYVTTFRGHINLRNCNNITRANFYNEITFPTNFFNDCQGLTVIFAPKASVSGNSYLADRCQNVTTVVIGSLNGCNYGLGDMKRNNVTNLKTIDVSGSGAAGSKCFFNNNSFDTLILRSTTIVPLNNVDAFQNTCFASGGAGGTIYIPKVLYDKLGTGEDDYEGATNWSTVNEYGTITWAKIEGSIYETQYADGTLIPTSAT